MFVNDGLILDSLGRLIMARAKSKSVKKKSVAKKATKKRTGAKNIPYTYNSMSISLPYKLVKNLAILSKLVALSLICLIMAFNCSKLRFSAAKDSFLTPDIVPSPIPS